MPPIRTLPAYPVGSASVGAWAGYMIGERSIGQAPAGEVVLYEAPDGDVRVDVRLAEETVWLSQAQMVELFERDQSVVSRHVRHVFAEGEVPEEGNMQVLHIASADRPAGEPMKVELDRQAWCGVLRLLRDYLGSHQVKMDNARIIDHAADGSVVRVEFISPSRGVNLAGVPRAAEIEREVRRLGLPIRTAESGDQRRASLDPPMTQPIRTSTDLVDRTFGGSGRTRR